MSPTIVLKDGKPVLVTGTPGGSRIISAVLQIVVDVIDYKMDIAAAVAGAARASPMDAGRGSRGTWVLAGNARCAAAERSTR